MSAKLIQICRSQHARDGYTMRGIELQSYPMRLCSNFLDNLLERVTMISSGNW
jgi:hypothetical protein